ncbi:MAG: YraN family protein [Gammaproteobacteria bacterium RIFCSPLOWO2_02_FULL_52_10]|nr:MAG: YraN family protein [Gammaproteobacteria bacterium RIFCSPLOWO2_12_FULL_52_10]OGT82592.1 MAG: YraN family protein [Gammaproteobacteria bacterium RIFCSPLOWO2_02_FULL_52_10]
MPVNTYTKGKLAEDIAYKYLKQQGLKLLVKNYRSPMGEIDLIMRDGEVTVFIEVRSRRHSRHMHAVESIDSGKRTHIVNTSEEYLQNQRRSNKEICRFDVVVLTGAPDSAQIEWIKNAFEA